MGSQKAFENVDRELGVAYDVIYTKVSVTGTKWGCILRFFIWIATMIVIVVYIVLAQHKNRLQVADHIITYMLLAWTVISDTHAIIVMPASAKWISNLLPKKPEIPLSSSCKMLPSPWGENGSNSLSQCNFIKLCIDKKNLSGDSKSLRKLLKHNKITRGYVDLELKKMIFDQLEQKVGKKKNVYDEKGWKERLALIGVWINIPEKMSTLEFHQTIIAWNIVTHLCYCYDNSPEPKYEVKREQSKKLSDYMFYLLVECRYMLPIGTGLVTLRDTFVEAKEFLKPMSNSEESEFCLNLKLRELTFPDTCYDPAKVPSKSVFILACKVAQLLLKEELNGKRWEDLAELWIEILAYAAGYCRVDNHAQQLRRGRVSIPYMAPSSSSWCAGAISTIRGEPFLRSANGVRRKQGSLCKIKAD